MRALLPVLAMVVLTAGCGFSFERSSDVLDRRILAIQAEPPEIVLNDGPPPSAVQLRALVVDPDEPEAVVEHEWRACLSLPDVAGEDAAAFGGTLANGRCDEEDPFTLIHAGTAGLNALFTSAPVPLPLVEALRAATSSGLAVSINLQAQLRIDLDEGEPLYGLKRVVVSPPLPEGRQANRNPRLAALLFDGEPWNPDEPLRLRPGACAGEDVTDVVESGRPGELARRCSYKITPVFDESEAEPYVVQTFDGQVRELRERLRFRWFTDRGTITDGYTAQPQELEPRRLDPLSTRWAEPNPAEGKATVWVVVRDGRGGASWERREILFEGP